MRGSEAIFDRSNPVPPKRHQPVSSFVDPAHVDFRFNLEKAIAAVPAIEPELGHGADR
jgi:hypothetical protein